MNLMGSLAKPVTFFKRIALPKGSVLEKVVVDFYFMDICYLVYTRAGPV